MTFLNPILLAGLAAISIPIIIHLLHRRKFQKVVWAAMRFLKLSVDQNKKRMRIEDIILLALRCLLLILLALALARPALMSESNDFLGQTKVTSVIIVDNSCSMGVTDGTQTRFEKARIAAEQALDSMPMGSAIAVFFASDIVQGAIPEPTFDFNLARRIIREVPLAVVRGNAAEIAALAGRKAAIRGVDAAGGEADSAAIAAGLAEELGCVVAVTGPIDTVAAADRTCRIANGHPWLANVTGTGCMATSLIGCCCGAAADPYVAAVAGLTAMGVAGELAHRALRPGEGIGTFRVKLFDAIFAITPELVLRYGQIG
jgi:hypothetical protein